MIVINATLVEGDRIRESRGKKGPKSTVAQLRLVCAQDGAVYPVWFSFSFFSFSLFPFFPL